MSTAPVVAWPTTDQGWCDWYRRLDAEYGTTTRSPLHHDHRCPIHTPEAHR